MKWFIQILVLLFCFVLFQNNVAKAGTEESYIVTFNQQIDIQLIESVGGTVDQQFEMIHAVSTTLSDEEVSQLRKSDKVRFIEENQDVHLQSQVTSWGYDMIITNRAERLDFTGQGVKIAVLDTGVDTTHPDLRIAGGANFVGYEPTYEDLNGHGTHVIGIIGAQANDIGTVGIAPDAEIYAVKVLDREGNGSQAEVIAGLEWAVQHDIDIVNLSLTSPQGSYALKSMLQKAYDEGMLIVAASGNGDGTSTLSTDDVQYPAKYDTVIAVGSIDQSKNRSYFTRYGTSLELSAPGEEIISSYKGDTYAISSGTSMATPFVTGTLALYKELYPTKTNSQIRSIVELYSTDLGKVGRDSEYGYGLVTAPNEEKIHGVSTLNVEPTSVDLKAGKVMLRWSESGYRTDLIKYNIYRNNELIDTVSGNVLTYLDDEVPYGYYSYSVSVIDLAGRESDKKTVNVSVDSGFAGFIDVKKSDWYSEAVMFLKDENIINGYPDGTFKPLQNISRAEVSMVIAKTLGLSTAQVENQFSDINSTYYASGAIQSLYEAQMVSGYPDHTFRPEDMITRGDAAIMIANAFEFNPPEQYTKFIDVEATYYGMDALQALTEAGILKGYEDGSIKPNAKITRGEFAALISRSLQ